MSKAVVFQQQPLPIHIVRIDQGLSQADAPEFAGLTVGGVSVIPANRPVLDLVTQTLVDHPGNTNNPHGVTAAQAGADAAGTAAGVIDAHLEAYGHEFIEHLNRAELDSINQPLGTASSVGFNCITLPSGNASLVWAGGSMLYEQTSALGGVNRMLYRPRGDAFEVLNQAGNSYIMSVTMARSQFFTPLAVGALSFTPDGMCQINVKNANTKALILKGYTGQAVNLFEVQDASSSVKAYIDSACRMFAQYLSVSNMYTSAIREPNASTNARIELGSAKTITLNTNNADRMVIDANGNVGIRTTTPKNVLHVTHLNGTPMAAVLQSEYMGTATFSGARLNNYGLSVVGASDTATGDRPIVGAVRARGTIDAPTAVVKGDQLFSFLSAAYDGQTLVYAATIDFVVDADVSIGAVPTAIGFATGPTGGTRYERMRITSSGNVGIGTIDPKSKLHVVGLSVYANNAAAVAGGLTAGAFYRTGADPDVVCVVH